MRHLGNNWWDRHYRMICWMLVFLLLFLLLHAIGLRITLSPSFPNDLLYLLQSF